MKLQLITDVSTLESYREQWDRLAGSFPFHRWAWLGNWKKTLGAETTPAVLVAADENGRWTGIAPLCVESKRNLIFWGSGTACTDYMGLICKPERKPAFTLAVADWLGENTSLGGALANIERIELEGITGDRECDQFLSDSLEAVGLTRHESELEGTWVADLPSSWETLNTTFSKSMRRKTKKAVSRLDNELTTVASTKTVDFEELWPTFVALHQQRRISLGQPGCFADPIFEQFLKSASCDLIDEGRAEMMIISHDQKPLASMLLFNDVHTNYMYQTGADTERMNLEPGYQVVLAAVRHSIDNGFLHFDFLRGDEPYKARWGTKRVPILRTRFVPRKLGAQVKHNIWATGKALKNYLRSAKN